MNYDLQCILIIVVASNRLVDFYEACCFMSKLFDLLKWH